MKSELIHLALLESIAAAATDPVAAAEAITAAELAWRAAGYERDEVLADTGHVDIEIVVTDRGVGVSPAASERPPRLLGPSALEAWSLANPDGIRLRGRDGAVRAPASIEDGQALRWACPDVEPGLVVVRCVVVRRGSGLLLEEVTPLAAW